jgi:hypothetical protein
MNDVTAKSTDQQAGHGCLAGADHDREIPEIDLLTPATFRGVTLRNRISSKRWAPRAIKSRREAFARW